MLLLFWFLVISTVEQVVLHWLDYVPVVVIFQKHLFVPGVEELEVFIFKGLVLLGTLLSFLS